MPARPGAHTGPSAAGRFQYSVHVCIMQAASSRNANHDSANIRIIGQGEATRRTYKGLKLGGGQAYDR